ncbi:bifunctional DNA primase/polymerase [Streptomyces sp. NPDC014734]|uniref:bifunctional DNA primase/polymerase n=1 Tax=Streptomyces sp. NPDC014734 TaxID=3364886 RepID=UPI0036F5D652
MSLEPRTHPSSAAVARWCAAAGWPVHPLAPLRKTPAASCASCRRPGHRVDGCPCLAGGRWCHGLLAATTDPALVTAWWDRHPGFGVGVSCGPAGLLVIDVDAHGRSLPGRHEVLPGIEIPETVELTGLSNGFHSLAVLAALRGQPDPAQDTNTLRVRTPSGGLHIWYDAGPGHRLRSSVGAGGRGLAWQVDVRAVGGYIVAPGTRTEAGVYERLGECVTPAPPPSWLCDELERTGHRAKPQEARTQLPARLDPALAAVLSAGWGSAAAHRALESVLTPVLDCATTASGAGFSDKLNRAAYTAGGLCAAGVVDAGRAQRMLAEVAERVRPGQQRRSAQIIDSGFTAGLRRPLVPKGRS